MRRSRTRPSGGDQAGRTPARDGAAVNRTRNVSQVQDDNLARAATTAARPRGRPPKFGRPSRLVALTLPEDVLAWLRSLDPDPARAIVRLFDQGHPRPEEVPGDAPLADIVVLTRRRGLIVVDRRAFAGLPDVDLLPLDATRAFLALEVGSGLADLELAIADRLDEVPAGSERESLSELRARLREWRRDPAWTFEARSILVAEQRRVPRG